MIEKGVSRKAFFISILMLLASIVALVAVTYSWFNNQRQLATAVWIKTPIILRIGSGNDKDIQYLDMGDIDVEAATEKDYVFCVYGSPVDNYSLQLAYTTNIPFTYTVYRAQLSTDGTGIPSQYEDETGYKTDYFKRINDNAVIHGYSLQKLADLGIDPQTHQSHHMSYGDENGLNPISSDKVQKYNEPLYWLASEDGASIMKPMQSGINTDASGTQYFLDYYILHVSWDTEVKNDKETDIVYLTVSR